LILRVDIAVHNRQGLIRQETRYFITSLCADEVSPERLMKIVRGHWCVENGLHYIKDRWWDEDRQWSIREGLAERLATLRDTVLTTLRLMPEMPANLPIRSRADHLGRNLPKALKFIGAIE
jgi:predicted transposase YbfD/YdcC